MATTNPLLALFKEQLEAECATLAVKHNLKEREPFEHSGRFTDTWVRQKGLWQCIASQFSIPVQN